MNIERCVVNESPIFWSFQLTVPCSERSHRLTGRESFWDIGTRTHTFQNQQNKIWPDNCINSYITMASSAHHHRQSLSAGALEPLRDALGDILARLEALEAATGSKVPPPPPPPSSQPPPHYSKSPSVAKLLAPLAPSSGHGRFRMLLWLRVGGT